MAQHLQRMGYSKSHLKPHRPANFEEWEALPLWRPHLNHVDGSLARCLSSAQWALRDNGFVHMADMLHNPMTTIKWEEAVRRGAPRRSQAAFDALFWNLKRIPKVDHPEELHDLFLQDTSGREITLAIQNPGQISLSPLDSFPDRQAPMPCTRYASFDINWPRQLIVFFLKKLPWSAFWYAVQNSCAHIYIWELMWNTDHLLLTQYKWRDSLPLSICQLPNCKSCKSLIIPKCMAHSSNGKDNLLVLFRQKFGN